MPPYYFTQIPGIIPAPFPGDAVNPGPSIVTSTRLLMEHQLAELKITTYRSDLTDGRRVYRTEFRFLERMRKDASGFFIEILGVKYYWTGTSPVTENDTYIREWGPL